MSVENLLAKKVINLDLLGTEYSPATKSEYIRVMLINLMDNIADAKYSDAPLLPLFRKLMTDVEAAVIFGGEFAKLNATLPRDKLPFM